MLIDSEVIMEGIENLYNRIGTLLSTFHNVYWFGYHSNTDFNQTWLHLFCLKPVL